MNFNKEKENETGIFQMSEPRVFVPHEPCRWDGLAQAQIPIYDLGAAVRYGTLTSILPRGAVTLSPGEVVRAMQEALADYTDDDFILCVGDPVLIATACMVAAQVNGDYTQMLRYDRYSKEYHPVEINLGE